MRNTFIKNLENELIRNENNYFLTGDLGFGVLNTIKEKMGERFINVGVAEQLMAGMAAGLAHTGKKVFIYSIANFPTFRCLEQIRNDICYHNLDVKIVSVGAGVAYGTHGYTHYGAEDIAVMKPLRNIEVICPADPVEAMSAASYCIENAGPAYIRLGKNNEPVIHENQQSIKDYVLKSHLTGGDILVLSTGSIGFNVKSAVTELYSESVDITFLSVPYVHPFGKVFHENICKYKKIFTFEEHSLSGGFGSTVLEELSKQGFKGDFHNFGLDLDINEVGSQSFMLEKMNLDIKGIKNTIKKYL